MKVVDVLERWCFPDGHGRAILVTCDVSYQKYVESLYEFFPELVASMAGFCGLRVSLQPRDGDINKVLYVHSISIDIDAVDLDVGRRIAVEYYKALEPLTKPAIVFTAGKGYALRIYLAKEYRDINEEQYRTMGEHIRDLLPNLVTVEIPHMKGFIRIPYTINEKSGRQVLLVDRDGQHVKDPKRALELIEEAEANPLEYIPELVKVEKREVESVRESVGNMSKNGYEYIEKLLESKVSDCRKRFGILIGLYLKNVLKKTEEEAFAMAKAWVEKNGGRGFYKSFIKSDFLPPRLETLKERGRFGAIDYSDCLDTLEALVSQKR